MKHKFVRMAKKTNYLTELIERHERWKAEGGERVEEEDEEALEMEEEDDEGWGDREFVSDVSGDEDGLSDLEDAFVSVEPPDRMSVHQLIFVSSHKTKMETKKSLRRSLDPRRKMKHRKAKWHWESGRHPHDHRSHRARDQRRSPGEDQEWRWNTNTKWKPSHSQKRHSRTGSASLLGSPHRYYILYSLPHVIPSMSCVLLAVESTI